MTRHEPPGWIVYCKSGQPFDVYVGRGPNSIFGNPWSHKENNSATFTVETASEAVDNFQKWLEGVDFKDILQEQREKILVRLPFLKNKVLACWCRVGTPCHARVLFKLANGFWPDIEINKQLFLFD